MGRGYIITWDALISLSFVVFLMLGFIGIQYSSYKARGSTPFEKLHSVAENSMDTINKQGVLEEIAFFWALGNASIAANMTADNFDRLIPPHVGYRLEAVDASGVHVIYASQTGPIWPKPPTRQGPQG
jgi:hypothetical protein